MKRMHLDSEVNTIAWTLLFGCIGLLCVIAYLCLQPKGRVSCADFGSYTDIPPNWQFITPWLDRNHNSIPCENLHKIYE